jgi:perosamine synthetase
MNPGPAQALDFIPQMEPAIGNEERTRVADYMAAPGWLTEYRNTAQFEKAVADYCACNTAIAVNSGTVALIMSALALELGPGDEVIVPNFTMIATPNAVKLTGATVVLVDVEPDTLCLDIEKTKAAITKNTKAIFLVAINGRYPAAGIEAFVDMCRERGIKLVEDAAQALGSRYPDGFHMGTKGSIGCLSFSAPKIITTGQGGMVLTNDDTMADKLRRLKDFGRSGGGNDIHPVIGYNFKFTELQACIGLAQMEKLAARVLRKKAIWKRYCSALAGINGLRLFDMDIENCVPWFIDVLADQREELQDYLRQQQIGTRVMYPPINKQLCYQVAGNFPVTAEVGKRGLWLPSASQLSDAQVDRVCAAIRDFYSDKH